MYKKQKHTLFNLRASCLETGKTTTPQINIKIHSELMIFVLNNLKVKQN
jgi:hypothetical protein